MEMRGNSDRGVNRQVVDVKKGVGGTGRSAERETGDTQTIQMCGTSCRFVEGEKNG